MVSTKDIYYRIDSKIVESGFWEGNADRKKQLIDDEMKKYITSKIQEVSENNPLLYDKNNYTTEELLSILSNCISPEERCETLRHFIHYVINVAGSLQNFAICWWVEDDKKLIDCPLIEFDNNGLWNSLKTHEQTDYVRAFSFVYDVFKNNFLINDKDTKRLVLATPKKMAKENKE